VNREQIASEIKTYLKSKSRDYRSIAEDVEVSFDGNTCTVRAESMYELRGLSFQDMKWFSELLKTEKINVRDEGYSPGCESCDFGSSAWWELECLEVGV